jgi:hypothetical protein
MIPPPLLRTTERKTFRRCPQQWWWAYEEWLKPRRRPAGALWFGIGVHEVLAEWYQPGFARGRLPWESWQDWVNAELAVIRAGLSDSERDEWSAEPYEEARVLGDAMLRNYIGTYHDDPDMEILAIEQPFEINIADEHDNVIAIFMGRLDGVFRDMRDGLIYLDENKTAAAIKTGHLPLDDQAGGYFSVANLVLRAEGVIGKREVIEGISYNFLRKAKPDGRPRNEGGAYLNKDGSVSAKQPAPYFHREPVDRSAHEVRSQLQRIAAEVAIMNKMRDGELEITKSVTDMCPSCPFWRMCLLHERGGHAWEEYRDMEYAIQDPYSDHRKSSAE